MSTWPKTKLEELIHIKHGYAFKGEYFVDYKTKEILLTPGNFKAGGGFQNPKPKYYDGPVPEGYVLKHGDYVVTMTDLSKEGDTLGYPAVIPKDNNRYLLNQRIGLITKKNEDICLNYIYYLMCTPRYQRSIVGSASGATVKHTSPKKIYEFKAKIPTDSKIQESIALTLRAYDDLIENNERRIKILEEMAQRLYTEWFVKFKFPGHEKVKLVDSGTKFGKIPEGWEVKNLKDVGKAVTGKTPSTQRSDFYGEDVPFIKTPDMHGNIFVHETSQSLSVLGAESQKTKYLPPKTVFVSCIGTLGLVGITAEKSQTNQQINSLLLNDPDDYCFFYYFAKEFGEMLRGLGSNGATMGNVNKTKFENIKLLYPDTKIRVEFNQISNKAFEQILNLQMQNKFLSQMRDVLIPQLVTGKRELK